MVSGSLDPSTVFKTVNIFLSGTQGCWIGVTGTTQALRISPPFTILFHKHSECAFTPSSRYLHLLEKAHRSSHPPSAPTAPAVFVRRYRMFPLALVSSECDLRCLQRSFVRVSQSPPTYLACHLICAWPSSLPCLILSLPSQHFLEILPELMYVRQDTHAFFPPSRNAFFWLTYCMDLLY